MASILIVEDEPDLARVLQFNFQQAGHTVTMTDHGRQAVTLVREQKPDLVLLDIMLPDISGTDVCKQLKRDPQTAAVPVLMLTAKGEEMDRVLGLELGAEDYVVKPFSVRELLLRIDVILQRRAVPAESSAHIEFGVLKIDVPAHRVWVDGAELELTTLEFRLLTTLCDRKNRVQSRDVLLNDVWGISADVTSRTVDTHVKRLREKLGIAGDYIETVRGVGYRFAAAPSARK